MTGAKAEGTVDRAPEGDLPFSLRVRNASLGLPVAWLQMPCPPSRPFLYGSSSPAHVQSSSPFSPPSLDFPSTLQTHISISSPNSFTKMGPEGKFFHRIKKVIYRNHLPLIKKHIECYNFYSARWNKKVLSSCRRMILTHSSLLQVIQPPQAI